MAGDGDARDGIEPDRFEEIDWSATDRSGLAAIPRKYRLAGLTYLLLAAALCYDYAALPAREPTIGALGWDLSGVDWLFVGALVALFWFALVPLAANPRLTRHYWAEFRKNRAAVVGLAYLAGIFVLGVLGPLFLDPPSIDLARKYQPPVYASIDAVYPIRCLGETVGGPGSQRCLGTWAHPLGTNSRGKDVLTIVVYGMGVSMKIGLVAAAMIVAIGTAVGTTAAYVGGLVDELLMRYVDVQLVFPAFLLYLLLLYLFGQSLLVFVLVFGLTGWGSTARLVRSEALQRSEEGYVTAARNAGASPFAVIWRHVVPNVSNTVITNATLLIPTLILFEAGLAFLDLGDPAIPSWGQLIAQGRSDLTVAWWVSTIPGVFLFLTILAFNFVGDALRDALDPRSHRGSR